MLNQQSPLENLASYAISFGAGILAVTVVTLYGRWMQRRGARQSSYHKDA